MILECTFNRLMRRKNVIILAPLKTILKSILGILDQRVHFPNQLCRYIDTQTQWHRLNGAPGARAPTFTNGWAQGAQ